MYHMTNKITKNLECTYLLAYKFYYYICVLYGNLIELNYQRKKKKYHDNCLFNFLKNKRKVLILQHLFFSKVQKTRSFISFYPKKEIYFHLNKEKVFIKLNKIYQRT